MSRDTIHTLVLLTLTDSMLFYWHYYDTSVDWLQSYAAVLGATFALLWYRTAVLSFCWQRVLKPAVPITALAGSAVVTLRRHARDLRAALAASPVASVPAALLAPEPSLLWWLAGAAVRRRGQQ
jgi:hypothetical protein